MQIRDNLVQVHLVTETSTAGDTLSERETETGGGSREPEPKSKTSRTMTLMLKIDKDHNSVLAAECFETLIVELQPLDDVNRILISYYFGNHLDNLDVWSFQLLKCVNFLLLTLNDEHFF